MSESFTEISYEVADAIAWVTLDRPHRLNAFTWVMATEIIAAMDAADADDSVRVVVITGRGRAFCAGADLARGEDTFNDDGSDPTRDASTRGTIGGVPRDGGGTVSLRIARMLKPVIAAVNGPAVGVGSTMILPADIPLVRAEDVREVVDALGDGARVVMVRAGDNGTNALAMRPVETIKGRAARPEHTGRPILKKRLVCCHLASLRRPRRVPEFLKPLPAFPAEFVVVPHVDESKVGAGILYVGVV